MKKSSWIIFSFVFVICCHLSILFFFHFNEKSSPNKFVHGFEKTYSTDVVGLEFSKLEEIFAQPFHFLGQGKQMRAYESADKQWVLKFFNPMRPLKRGWTRRWKWWGRTASLKWISREWFCKKKRLKKLFYRHKIAYEYLKEETGLVFVHLSPSEKVSHYVHLFDPYEKKHILHLANAPFVLQKKATLVGPFLHQLLAEEKIVEAKLAISELEKLFEKSLEVGITDRIQTMHNNYGFVDQKPIQIDVGRIHYLPSLKEHPDAERERILHNFHAWIQNHFPQLEIL